MSQGQMSGSLGATGKPGVNTSSQIAQQGMSPTPVQSTIGQGGPVFGQPMTQVPSQSQGTNTSTGTGITPGNTPGNMATGKPGVGQNLGGSIPNIDTSLAGGVGPDTQAIGPISPVTQDQLNGLPGPDDQQGYMLWQHKLNPQVY